MDTSREYSSSPQRFNTAPSWVMQNSIRRRFVSMHPPLRSYEGERLGSGTLIKLVPINALVLTGLATFRVVGNPEVEDVLANEHLLLPVAPHSEGCEFSQIDPRKRRSRVYLASRVRIAPTAGIVMSSSTPAPIPYCLLLAIFMAEFLRFGGHGSKLRRRDTAFGSRFVGRGDLQNDIFLSRLRSKNEREG
jgi:hypothetical protein